MIDTDFEHYMRLAVEEKHKEKQDIEVAHSGSFELRGIVDKTIIILSKDKYDKRQALQ
jgi:hypothetical protein